MLFSDGNRFFNEIIIFVVVVVVVGRFALFANNQPEETLRRFVLLTHTLWSLAFCV